MRNEIPDHLRHAVNKHVLEYLDGRSSHGDLTEVFLKTIGGLAEAKYFYPSHYPYAYCFAHANSKIFGFCRSMRSMSFLLPENMHAKARKVGGFPNEDLEGSGWFDFPAFDTNIEPNRIKWAKAAYSSALK